MKRNAILFIIVGLIFFVACDKNKNDGTTKLEIRLTDTPAPYEEVNINITSVMINMTDSEDSGWQDLGIVNPGIYNLLDLRNGLDTLLVSRDVASGRLNQIRLILGTGNSVKINGQLYDMATPSAQQSGLKLNFNSELVAGVTYRLWIDFDAMKSIVAQGNGGYSLKPVLRAYTEALSGSISGTVLPAEARATVTATLGDESYTVYPDENGYFLFPGLSSGMWTVSYNAAAGTGYTDMAISGVLVTVGNNRSLGTVVLTE